MCRMEMGGADIVGGGKRELQPLMDSPLHRGDKGKGSKKKKKKKKEPFLKELVN